MKKVKLKGFYSTKQENKKLYFTILLKCAECFGYFADGYQKCDSTICPLFPYFPTVKQYNSLIKTRKCQEKKREAFS
ncbi:MAG: hypothetical protein FJW63_09995 [Actinobacteria bacterium]|nr:hypothetical protein [Actinomycetota bacterium]